MTRGRAIAGRATVGRAMEEDEEEDIKEYKDE